MATDQAELAAWVQRNLPRDARVLIHDAGHIAFATDLFLIDVVGLKTPDAIADHRRWTVPSRGLARQEAVSRIAARHGATHAIILKDLEGYWASLADDLRRSGWTLEPLRPARTSPGYEVFKLIPAA